MCANTSIGQLLKIPNLIEHYIEHKNELTTASISFIDFLESHYSKNAENNKEEHQDLIDDVRDNYRFIGTREAIGYDERTW